jgi:hypothetical protein
VPGTLCTAIFRSATDFLGSGMIPSVIKGVRGFPSVRTSRSCIGCCEAQDSRLDYPLRGSAAGESRLRGWDRLVSGTGHALDTDGMTQRGFERLRRTGEQTQ